MPHYLIALIWSLCVYDLRQSATIVPRSIIPVPHKFSNPIETPLHMLLDLSQHWLELLTLGQFYIIIMRVEKRARTLMRRLMYGKVEVNARP